MLPELQRAIARLLNVMALKREMRFPISIRNRYL